MKKVLLMVVVLGLVWGMIPAPAQAQTFCDMTNGLIVDTLASGINCLDDNGWQGFPLVGSNLPFSSADDMAVCPDNTLVAIDLFGGYRYDGSAWSDMSGTPSWFSPSAITCGEGGQMWVAHGEGASYFDGSAWTEFPQDQFGVTSFGVEDIAMGANGSVWALTSETAATFVDGAWQVFSEGNGFNESYSFSFGKIVLDSDGLPWVTYSGGLLHYDGTSWAEQDAGGLLSIQSVAVDGQGRIWAGSFSEGVAMYDGSSWTVFNRDNSGIGSNQVRALAVDAQGRVWAGTEWGLSVFDGTNWTTFQMSNSELLDNSVMGLIVTGNGPALPALVEKQPGVVTGIIEYGVDPLPGTQVELCTESVGGVYYGDTPCSGQPGHMIVTTGEDGTFTFEGVPVGRYELAVETPDGWISFIGIDSEVEVLEGQTVDLADIDVSG